MNKKRLKLCSLVIACSVTMMLLTACFNNGKKEVIELADSFAEAVCDLDVDGMEDLLSDPDEDYLDILREELVFDDSSFYNSNETIIFPAIAESLDYEVNEDSVEVSKKDKSGSAKVSFTMVDYKTIYEDGDFSDVYDFADELSSSDETISVDVKLRFVLEDGEWLVKDSSLEDAIAVYEEFVFYDFSFSADLSNASITYEWFFEEETNEDGTPVYYTTSDSIDLDLYFEDYSVDYSEVYFTVAHEGEEIYVSEPNNTDAWFYPEYASWTSLLQGTYVISFFDGNNNLIFSSSCLVIDKGQTQTDFTMQWYYSDTQGENGQNGVYSANCYSIDLDWTNCPDHSLTNYEVYYYEELVYTSGLGTYEGYFDEDHGATLVGGYLPSGEYVIKFYYNGEEVCQGNAFVNMGNPPTNTECFNYINNLSSYDLNLLLNDDFESYIDSVGYLGSEWGLHGENVVYYPGATEAGTIITMNSENPYNELYAKCYYISSEIFTEITTISGSFYAFLHQLTDSNEYSVGTVQQIDNQYVLSVSNDSGLEDGVYVLAFSTTEEFTEDSVVAFLALPVTITE